ncbi:DUF805 domain-containing protein [Microbacterium oleivorans]|uniref:DUF805 domain-containing protein n=1 Tax=Microbacterium oleivorans TaxID=273677 RepID=A0A177KAD8_9MICO|nr:DUF805 domain-containing protein [Microbacterium oleivorans]OAH50378.1 hypothetical protein AYL44_07935 [Microbacterium oleivorans]
MLPAAGPGQPPLEWPLYGASFAQAFVRYWKKYATFTGRASLSEFWWMRLAYFLIAMVLVVIMIGGALVGVSYDPVTGQSRPGPLIAVGAILLVLFLLATIIPDAALTWRRLHDANLPGPLFFLAFIPSLGSLVLLVLTLLPTNPAGRRFG